MKREGEKISCCHPSNLKSASVYIGVKHKNTQTKNKNHISREEINLKKIAILVASVLVFGGFSTRTFAAEATTQTTQTPEAVVSYKEEAGITPDSLLYVIDKAVDDLRVLLAGSDEKEAAVNADIAEERLGESEVMTEEGKVELAQKALEEYNEAITEAAEKLQAVVVNLEPTAEESSEEATEEVVEENTDSKLEQSITDLEKAIQEVQDKSLVVLDSLKGLVAEESVEAVEDVIEEQTTHKEAVANFVAERHEFNAAKKSLNMAKVALKKLEKGGDEEAVKAAQDKLAAAKEEYMLAQTELHAAFQAKKAADFGIEEDKEEAAQAPTEEAVTAEENNQAVEDAAVEEEAKPAEYTKTNNGNGNGNKSTKIEKEKKDKEKSAPVKSAEENGKSSQAKGNKK
jgi:uncharacterized protein YeeX (DUF496 family)